MKAEILCVGTELLLGDIINTNAAWLAKELAALGINCYYQTVVGDNQNRLKETLEIASKRSDLIITTGGLGPTKDDLTKEVVCEYFGYNLFEDKESLKQIEDYFKKTNRKMTENNIKQAFFPKDNCTIFKNENGTAPGCALETENCTVIILPGPPREMSEMFKNSVKDYLAKLSNTSIVSHNVELCGIGESMVAEIADEILKGSNPTVSPYAKTGRVTLRVTASAENKTNAELLCKHEIEKLQNIFGDLIFGIDVNDLQSVVVSLLNDANLTVGTAESCTAGLLSSKIADVSGASNVFSFGMTVYSADAKINRLGVSKKTIEKYGTVSPLTAFEMAKCIKNLSKANIGIGITGVAGPSETENKPVGLVYISLVADNFAVVETANISNRKTERQKIREMATLYALDLLRNYLIDSKAINKLKTVEYDLFANITPTQLTSLNLGKDM